MAYEGHIAGVGDRPPGKRLQGRVIEWMQRRSAAEIEQRRGAVVAAVSELADLEFVNGGGTGSLHGTTGEAAVTELAAGSGFFAPTLFDAYSSFRLRPAAMFAMPVVRKPAPAIATVLGGGYLASGVGEPSRVPSPHLPAGLALDRFEGAGEVQTPLHGDARPRARGRGPRLLPPREGRRAVRALRQPAPDLRRPDRRRGPDLPRRGPHLPLGAQAVCRAAASSRMRSTISGGALLGRAGVERRLRVVLDQELDRLGELLARDLRRAGTAPCRCPTTRPRR